MSKRGKRRYRLTPSGLRPLPAGVRKTRSWRKSTGPSTPEGRAQSQPKRPYARAADDAQGSFTKHRTTGGLLRMLRVMLPCEQAGFDCARAAARVRDDGRPVPASNLNLAIDEDQYADSERKHVAEQVGYIVFAD